MSVILVGGKCIDLPVSFLPMAPSDRSAWLHAKWVTAKVFSPIEGVRVHTNGRSFHGRPASGSSGRWVALSDETIIATSGEIASTLSLPKSPGDPQPNFFTHASRVVIPAFCVLNIGIASALFGGTGGGWQAEILGDLRPQFQPLTGKTWHGSSGNA